MFVHPGCIYLRSSVQEVEFRFTDLIPMLKIEHTYHGIQYLEINLGKHLINYLV